MQVEFNMVTPFDPPVWIGGIKTDAGRDRPFTIHYVTRSRSTRFGNGTEFDREDDTWLPYVGQEEGDMAVVEVANSPEVPEGRGIELGLFASHSEQIVRVPQGGTAEELL